MARAGKPVTSSDVARAAGVSRSTVSFVLNDVQSIALSDETKQRVRDAARELGYVPHSGARALRSGYSGIVLMPSARGPMGRLVLEWTTELEDELNSLGLTLVVFGSRGLDPVEAARAWSMFRPVVVLTLGSVRLPEEARDVLLANGTRALVTTGDAPLPEAHVLITGQATVGSIAFEHLIERGRRRLGVLVPREVGIRELADERATRALATAERHGVPAVALPIAYTQESALEVAARCIAEGRDGVFGFDDDYSLLLMGALQELGASVPADIALVGADDLVTGAVARPSLTTVRLQFPPAHDVADVMQRLSRGETGVRATSSGSPPTLVVRDSS